MDIVRKHRNLLDYRATAPGIAVLKAAPGLPIVPFEMESDYVLAEVPADPGYLVQVRVEVKLRDSGLFQTETVENSLRILVRLARDITGKYDK